MKLDKAIELLQLDLDDPSSVPIEDLNKAQELGIEALRRVKNLRRFDGISHQKPLPGETKE